MQQARARAGQGEGEKCYRNLCNLVCVESEEKKGGDEEKVNVGRLMS